MTDSLLVRLSSHSYVQTEGLTPFQRGVDHAVSQFVHQTTEVAPLAGFFLGSIGNQLVQAGLSQIFQASRYHSLLSPFIQASGLFTEASIFEFTQRSTSVLRGEQNSSYLFQTEGLQGWKNTLPTGILNLGALRVGHRLFSHQNLLLQHASTSTLMVASHQLSHALNFTQAPEGSLAEQVFFAEIQNIQFGLGQHLSHKFVPQAFAMQRGLQLYTRSIYPPSFLSEAHAMLPALAAGRNTRVAATLHELMSKPLLMSNEGEGSGSGSSSGSSRSERPSGRRTPLYIPPKSDLPPPSTPLEQALEKAADSVRPEASHTLFYDAPFFETAKNERPYTIETHEPEIVDPLTLGTLREERNLLYIAMLTQIRSGPHRISQIPPPDAGNLHETPLDICERLIRRQIQEDRPDLSPQELKDLPLQFNIETAGHLSQQNTVRFYTQKIEEGRYEVSIVNLRHQRFLRMEAEVWESSPAVDAEATPFIPSVKMAPPPSDLTPQASAVEMQGLVDRSFAEEPGVDPLEATPRVPIASMAELLGASSSANPAARDTKPSPSWSISGDTAHETPVSIASEVRKAIERGDFATPVPRLGNPDRKIVNLDIVADELQSLARRHPSQEIKMGSTHFAINLEQGAQEIAQVLKAISTEDLLALSDRNQKGSFPQQPVLITGASNGPGFQLIVLGMTSGTFRHSLTFDPLPLKPQTKDGFEIQAGLSRLAGLRLLSEVLGATFEDASQLQIEGSQMMLGGQYQNKLHRVRSGRTDTSLIVFNTLGLHPSEAVFSEAPRLQKEIFDLDDQGQLMFFSKSQRQRPAKINPRTLEGMHLPFLQAHENFFGGHSRSVYFSWRHPEDFDLFPTHQPYQIDSLERFRSVNESGSNTEHLISQGRNFALGQHWVATLPFEFSSTLTSLPGARLAQHIERRVLEEAQSYRAPVQTLAALLSFISQKNLRSPVSPRIELDRNRIEFQGAIRARHEEIFARIEAYRLTHPNWNATQPLSLEETQRILQTGP